jgi:lipoyl synthase
VLLTVIRLSAGTAACLGLSANRMDAYPTTAYLLSGNRCLMSCAFCPQGLGKSEALNRLGRITWPEYTWAEVGRALAEAKAKGVERICLQSVRHPAGLAPLLDQIQKIKAISDLPLSLSAWIDSNEEAEVVVEAGVERLAISLDVANPALYRHLKGGSFERKFELLLGCAAALPGRISTHLICGLGESEEDLLTLAAKLIKAQVTLALFAFVPLKGTRLEKSEPPALDHYRRMQAAFYLLREKKITFDLLKFEQGRLTNFNLTAHDLIQGLADGEAFRTSGCPGCNRPYYNERPGKTIYNYHRPLDEKELEAALSLVIDTVNAGGRSPSEKII